MRKKIYYSKSEITENLYTSGQQWMTEDSREYIGMYHRYSTGEVYSEEKWKPNQSKKLVKFIPQIDSNITYKNLKPNLKTKFINPIPYFIKVNAQDIQNKFVTRYFLQKNNQPDVLEINDKQYKLWLENKINRSLYTAVIVKWQISGSPTTTNINGANKLGVFEFNTEQIIKAKRTLPAIETKLNNPFELYVDTTIIVPPSINPAD